MSPSHATKTGEVWSVLNVPQICGSALCERDVPVLEHRAYQTMPTLAQAAASGKNDERRSAH